MKRHLGPLIAVILALALNATLPARALDLTLAQSHSLLAIHDAAVRWHVSEAWLDHVAFCESTWTPWAYNPRDTDGQADFGLFQWHIQTWNAYANALDRSKGPLNAWAAAYETAKLFAEGKSYLWGCADAAH